MKHSDNITIIGNYWDNMFLTKRLFPVNMRLFHSSDRYRETIKICCQHIADFCTGAGMTGYKKPHGMSGANCGIPFNIIAFLEGRNTPNESVRIMLNPEIMNYAGKLVKSMSNCGSLLLKEPIEIKRRERVRVNYYDINGNRHEEWFTRDQCGFTIQHEIDHNNGILITDRV